MHGGGGMGGMSFNQPAMGPPMTNNYGTGFSEYVDLWYRGSDLH